jgi:hypothetical protein
MSRFPSLIRSQCAVAGWFGALVLGGLVVQLLSAGAASIANATNNQSGNPDHTNGGAQIECVTPDGRVSPLANPGVGNPGAPALMMDDETISCALPEGQTTFIIPIFKTALLDRFTFVNRNAAACGEFDISVSNSHLPADSPKWTQVNGMVPFAHKRLFNLSMLGVEAKYMRLSFHVEKASQRTGLGPYRDEKEPADAIAKTAKLPASAESPKGKIAIFIASVF